MKYFSYLLLLVTLYSCKKEPAVITPDTYMSNTAQENFKYSVIRYVDDLARKATKETKFDTVFDAEYKSRAERASLLYYYKDKDSTVYFAITKIAPSLKVKRVATVGKIKYKGNEIQEYEEAFRTWKMEEPELNEKTEMLFRKYIAGEDVSPYYTKNTGGEFYIEFPDDNTYFDKETRSWAVKK